MCQRFYHIHVGTVTRHGDGKHFDAESFGDGEMPVIAGRGAEEFDGALIFPRRRNAVCAEKHRPADRIIHHCETGIAAENDLVFMDAEKFRHDAGKLRNAVRKPIIARIEARVGFAVPAVRKCGQHRIGKSKLAWTGLSTGHIEGKSFFFDCFILCAKRLAYCVKLFAG